MLLHKRVIGQDELSAVSDAVIGQAGKDPKVHRFIYILRTHWRREDGISKGFGRSFI